MKIGQHEVDLKAVLPLTVGDWKKLEAKGITAQLLSEVNNITVTRLSEIVLMAAQKANSAIVETDIDALTMPQLMSAFNEVTTADEAAVNRPT